MSMEMLGVEVVKAIIVLLLQESVKAGLTQDQLVALIVSERAKLYANDPAKIPG